MGGVLPGKINKRVTLFSILNDVSSKDVFE